MAATVVEKHKILPPPPPENVPLYGSRIVFLQFSFIQSNYGYMQFDRQWFGEGKLPNLPGAPKFGHSSSVKESHQLSDTIYKLKKMLHSSKVKLQAAR